MAVLILMAMFQTSSHVERLWPLTFLLGGSLFVLQLVDDRILSRWWFQASFFVGDALVATGVLMWLSPKADLFLLYLLLVFGSALTRSAKQRWIIAIVAIALYLVTGWRPVLGWPTNPEFWLRAVFLAVSAALMTVLASDTRKAQEDQSRRFEERLVQVGRLATLGRVAGEVAHRIKGPLTTISVDAEVLSSRLSHDKAALKELHEIRDQVERCKTILKDLLDLGRIEEMDMRPLDLAVPLRAAVKAISSQAKRRSIKFVVAGLDHKMRAKGDITLIQEAVAALLQNALEAAKDEGQISLTASTAGRWHRVAIVDDGVGISSENLERIFEPFFTTKKGEGSGLGLSAALRIAAKHGGTVEVDSAGPGRGACFTLVLPKS